MSNKFVSLSGIILSIENSKLVTWTVMTKTTSNTLSGDDKNYGHLNEKSMR